MTDQAPSNSLSLDAIVEKMDSKKLLLELDLPNVFAKQWVTTEADRDFAWELLAANQRSTGVKPDGGVRVKNIWLKNIWAFEPTAY